MRPTLLLPGVTFIAFLTCGLAVPALAQTVEQLEANPALKPLDVTTSWIGNTWGYGNGKYVQNNVQYLWVKPDGTCFTGSNWDEGHYAGGIYRAGDRLGTLQDTFQDFAGVGSLTGDERYIYASRRNGTIRRYNFDGGHAPFAGGVGERGSEVKLTPDAAPAADHPAITALAVDATRHLLYAAVEGRDKADAVVGAPVVNVFDVADGIKPLRTFAAPARVRAMVVAADGSLWAARARADGQPGGVAHLSADGSPLKPTLSAGEGFDPVALCLGADGNVWAADGGADQNVKIFSPDGKLARTFGETGGVFAGPTPGRVGPLRFDGITGVGVDAKGNAYVGQNRVGPHATGFAVSGGILESYAPDSTRNWTLHSLEFVDCADVDPASLGKEKLDVYTKLAHYTVDLSKPNGHQWEYVGAMMDFVHYPEDDRFAAANDNFDIRAGAWVRRIEGKKFLFVNTMASTHLNVYRFDEAHGEVAIPCGRIDKDQIWRDLNGNGRPDDGETINGPGLPTPLWVSFWVDSKGDLWQTTDGSGKTGVRHFQLAGLDEHGSPIWNYGNEHFKQEVADLGPAPLNQICRLQYQADADAMYLTGYSAADSVPTHNRFPGHGYNTPGYATKFLGPFVARYDRWSKGNRKPTWAVRIPYGGPKQDNTHANAAAFSVAGDCLFVGYEGLFDDANSGRIQVYRSADGGYVGTIHAGPESGNIEGAMDIPHGVNAVRLPGAGGGEYLIFSEDDWHAKVLMYRWRPAGKPTPHK